MDTSIKLEDFLLKETLHRIPAELLAILGERTDLKKLIAANAQKVKDKTDPEVPPRLWTKASCYNVHSLWFMIYEGYHNRDPGIDPRMHYKELASAHFESDKEAEHHLNYIIKAWAMMRPWRSPNAKA